MEKVSKGDCRCELLSGNSELFKIENSIRKKCSGVEASWWNTEFEKILKEFLTTQSIQNLRKTSESQQPNFDLVNKNQKRFLKIIIFLAEFMPNKIWFLIAFRLVCFTFGKKAFLD